MADETIRAMDRSVCVGTPMFRDYEVFCPDADVHEDNPERVSAESPGDAAIRFLSAKDAELDYCFARRETPTEVYVRFLGTKDYQRYWVGGEFRPSYWSKLCL